ncbi:MAG: hypothetical protein QS748_04360 [Candidatus Endonucleobacter bathymodioli]|uniref:WD domain, G-beta repeat n=1 Tax=Candidatus Endonucleibacter bathymodioli TaxID=539814 RepID=A0AA90SCS4_9GAMM|nr:hypothetical protein [Candidatus Endonucleobacter bathymodioli]
MRSVLSFMILFVFLSLSIPQQSIAMLELIDQAKDAPLVSTSNIVKIMAPIPLHKQESSGDKVINFHGVNISLNILKMIFHLVSASNDDKEQEAGLSKMTDAINKDNECPVTVISVDNDFNFMMIKQPNEEYLGILSIEPTPKDEFICLPELSLVDQINSLMSIKTTEIDSQGNNTLLQMDDCSIELLKKHHARSSETDDDTSFTLYISCKVKGVAANDNLSSCYEAFLCRQKNFDLGEALNRLSLLNEDDDSQYEEVAQEKSVLIQASLVVKRQILKLLSFRDMLTLRETCLTTKRLIENNKPIFFRSWFYCFTPQQRMSLKEYVKNTTKDDIYALVTQFSTETDIAKDIVMTRYLNYHTEIIFYTRSRLMACCPAFKAENIFSTNESWDRGHQTTFSPDDSYLVIHYTNSLGIDVSEIYELGLSGKWMQGLISCARLNADDNKIYKNVFIDVASFSACNRYIIICWANKTGAIYEMNSEGEWTKKISVTHKPSNCSATFSPDSSHVVTSCYDKTAKIYRLNSDLSGLEEVTINHIGPVALAIFSDNGCSVMTSSKERHTTKNGRSYYMGLTKIHGRNSDSPWTEKLAMYDYGYVVLKGFSPDSRYAMDIVSVKTARIYSLDFFGEWTTPPPIKIHHKKMITSARFSPDSRYLATASNDFTVKIYGRHSKEDNVSKKEEWREQATIYHNEKVSSATFSRDGRHLITSCKDGSAIICGLVSGETWKKKTTISMCVNEFVEAIFSDDSSQALVFSMHSVDSIVKIYEQGQNSEDEWTQKDIIQEGKYIISASFSADGNHIITAGADNIVRIYGWTSDRKLHRKTSIKHDKLIHSARFTHDCSHVVVTHTDSSIKIWRLFLDRDTQK